MRSNQFEFSFSCVDDDSIAQWMEALSALPKFCGSWHLHGAAAAIPNGADVRLRLMSEIDSSSKPCFEEEIIKCVALDYVICHDVLSL